MNDFVINDHILNQEAREIVDEILSQADEGQDIEELIWKAVDGHEWVIYTYKTLYAACRNYLNELEAA